MTKRKHAKEQQKNNSGIYTNACPGRRTAKLMSAGRQCLQMRIVEVITDAAHRDSLAGIAEHFQALDFWWG